VKRYSGEGQQKSGLSRTGGGTEEEGSWRGGVKEIGGGGRVEGLGDTTLEVRMGKSTGKGEPGISKTINFFI